MDTSSTAELKLLFTDCKLSSKEDNSESSDSNVLFIELNTGILLDVYSVNSCKGKENIDTKT